MSQERLTLRKIREILRLKEEAGLSNRAIARACKISNSTVGEYLRRAGFQSSAWDQAQTEQYRKRKDARRSQARSHSTESPEPLHAKSGCDFLKILRNLPGEYARSEIHGPDIRDSV